MASCPTCVRGGHDQFSWEDVKNDKDRESYLGHSLKAPVGRWQKGKDLLWYSHNKDAAGQRAEEIRAIKEQEELAMAEALGMKISRPTEAVTAADLQDVMRKDQEDYLEENEELKEAETVRGVGYKGSGRYNNIQEQISVLEAKRSKSGLPSFKQGHIDQEDGPMAERLPTRSHPVATLEDRREAPVEKEGRSHKKKKHSSRRRETSDSDSGHKRHKHASHRSESRRERRSRRSPDERPTSSSRRRHRTRSRSPRHHSRR